MPKHQPKAEKLDGARRLHAQVADNEERIVRKPSVQLMLSDSSTTLDENVKAGLVTPPLKIGPRRIAWPISEIRSIVRARIACESPDQIRDLVRRLVAKRAAP